MNQSFKHFATRTTDIKALRLLVMYSTYNTFPTIQMANTALPWSFSAVTRDIFCYLGHAHALYQWQGHSSAKYMPADFSQYVQSCWIYESVVSLKIHLLRHLASFIHYWPSFFYFPPLKRSKVLKECCTIIRNFIVNNYVNQDSSRIITRIFFAIL